MELITILKGCHRFRGFVHQHAQFSTDKKSIEVAVRPRNNSAAVCSRCHLPAPATTSSPNGALSDALTHRAYEEHRAVTRQHRELILNYFRARKLLSSGVVEGLNNKAKVTRRKS